MQATCGGCVFRARSGVLTDPEVMRLAREHDDEAHRVTVWDGPTSQLPRELWR